MQSGENIGSMRTKGVNVKIIPQSALRFMKSYLFAKFEAYRCYSY